MPVMGTEPVDFRCLADTLVAMSQTFEKAPLVEIIVEVRWADAAGFPQAGGGLLQLPVNNAADEFYMRFGGAAYSNGFRQTERLVPPGFPVMPGQAIYRYRPASDFPDELARSALWQIGSGVFTANATPPYKSWLEFSPWVAKGIQAVLDTRNEAEKNSDFASISLRYIDAFTSDFIGGLSYEEFLQERLGFKVQLPPAIEKMAADGATAEHIIQFRLLLQNGMSLTVLAAKGTSNGVDALILNTTVSTTEKTAANVETVMAKLSDARNMIHNSFVEMTSDIHGIMKPTSKD
ncbi:hypothetical protein C4F17_24380 [Variovorax sp. PMC12]|nr:hypothetical protein C4F17_24380 [Variovorax sp. PMC12]